MKIKTQIINIGIEEDPNPDRLNIETREKKSKLFNLLKEHKDVFTWSYQNMPGIDPDVVNTAFPCTSMQNLWNRSYAGSNLARCSRSKGG